MRFIEWIKSKIFGNKNKMLQESFGAKDNIYNDSKYEKNKESMSNFKDKYSVKKESYRPQVGTLDYAIDQYANSIICQLQKNNYKYYDKYSALVSLGGMNYDDPQRLNFANQKELINDLYKRNDLECVSQPPDSDNPAFYHIGKPCYQHGMKRIYLNCKRENISKLANELISTMDQNGQEYYFKFETDQEASRVSRSEAIVFYIKDDNQMNQIVNSIETIRCRDPKIFDGSNNLNPFLKNINGYIGYANNIEEGNYHSIDGYNKKISKSYNTLLSEALEDSMMHTIKDIVTSDEKLSSASTSNDFINPSVCCNTYLPYIQRNEQYRKQMISRMKMYLKDASLKNDELDIKGINKEDKTIQI